MLLRVGRYSRTRVSPSPTAAECRDAQTLSLGVKLKNEWCCTVLYCIVLFCIDAKLCWDSKFPCFTDFLHTVSLCEYEQSRINDPVLLKNILTHIKMKQHKNCILI